MSPTSGPDCLRSGVRTSASWVFVRTQFYWVLHQDPRFLGLMFLNIIICILNIIIFIIKNSIICVINIIIFIIIESINIKNIIICVINIIIFIIINNIIIKILLFVL